jgi:uncharacterized cupredoxin-like copper-binding protein
VRRSIPSILVVTAAVAVLGVAGCGDDDNDSSAGGGSDTGTAAESGGGYGGGTQSGGASSAGGGSTLKLAAVTGGELKFDRSSLSTKAGKVTIDFDNPSGATAPHAVEVEGNGVEEETETIQPGEKSSLTADLKPGTYEFYCPVGGHEQAGMKGTLTVE